MALSEDIAAISAKYFETPPDKIEERKRREPKRRYKPALVRGTKKFQRHVDTSLLWMEQELPALAEWRALALDWLQTQPRSTSIKLAALIKFFDKYITQKKLPTAPATLLSRSVTLPDFYKAACPKSLEGIRYNNFIYEFLQFVLLRDFSMPSDHGTPAISPAFHNPVPRIPMSQAPKRDESVYSPLPYGYIDELRTMIAEGPNFKDWKWAQDPNGYSAESEIIIVGAGWFEVTEAQIDRKDPDCVWRTRLVEGKPQFLMWSPVRWVALLLKLILPLRTFQVRMLDSGESDTWRYEGGRWKLNTHSLAQGNERRPVRQGVFRRTNPLTDGEDVAATLYISTNKTADIASSRSEKGYVLPWVMGGPVHQDAFYWLEKLRNWQEKYNPIKRRTPWSVLDGRFISAKSDVQLAAYPDACFLFRTPENTHKGEGHFPIAATTLPIIWSRVLTELEKRVANRGETHRNGSSIRFVPPIEGKVPNRIATHFPLHSLRVSLVTALALEGRVPFPILQKLVGHSRLLMTLYYTKPGATHIRDILVGAAERLEAGKETSIQNFLLDTEHDQLLQQAICNNASSLTAAMPQHPAARNPAGWMLMHHGLCLVGGNTSELEGNNKIGGCYNGGVNIGTTTAPKHGPVPGGSRNCVRCRWFVTEPHYLPALAAHFNTLAYHFDEARNVCLAREEVLQNLKKHKADIEDKGQPFLHLDAYRQAERIWEGAMKRFSDLAEDTVACYRLIERCKTALDEPNKAGTQLVVAGSVGEVQLFFEETESELLQLAGVCESVEIYPDLDPGKAVFRRSQLLDAVLYRDNLPPMFLLLSEQEQLHLGNAFMRRLAQQMDPTNPALGQREVIRLLDAGFSLSEHFGIDIATLLPATRPVKATLSDRMAIMEEK